MDTAKVIKISEPLLPGPHRGVEKPPDVKRLARHRPKCGSARQGRQGQRRPARNAARRCGNGRDSRRRTDPRGRGRNNGPPERQCRAGHAVLPERGSALRKRRRRWDRLRLAETGTTARPERGSALRKRQRQGRRPVRKAISRRTCGLPGTRLRAAEKTGTAEHGSAAGERAAETTETAEAAVAGPTRAAGAGAAEAAAANSRSELSRRRRVFA